MCFVFFFFLKSGTPIFNCQLMLDFCLKDTLPKKKKRVNICLGVHLIFHLPPPNPTIFTRIELLVFKFSLHFYLTRRHTLCHPFSLCYKYVNIVKIEVSWVIHLKFKELSKVTFSFLPVSLFHSLSLLHFFFLDFSSKFVWHKNFEGILDLLESVPIFLKKVNK